ncbi:TetR/AcrR family transcriptional regulator [bacterium LRH843]|nr:TetR/AcrR family transcriptional regulator [bacterium LRH843]
MKDRKQQVLLTAQRLFIENGFSATSVQDILTASNISKGTFYNYFSSKNECLIAILEYVHDKAAKKRRELLIGQCISDKNVLIEQILIRMQMNKEFNIISLFEAIFHSHDPDLRMFIKKYHLEELTWLAGRLVDVYGEEAAPFVSDCSAMMLGIIRQMNLIWTARSKKEMSSIELIRYTMRRIDSIIPAMIQSNDVLLKDEASFFPGRSEDEHPDTKHQLLTQLTIFSKSVAQDAKPKAIQYTKFLLDEIHSDHPRSFLLETVVRSFQEAFMGTPYQPEAEELAEDIWNYSEGLERENKE